VPNGSDLVMKSNARPCINAEIVLHSIWILFVFNLAEIRALDEVAGEMAVSLMQNWSSRITSHVVGLLTRK
jgi:hypothetical protein